MNKMITLLVLGAALGLRAVAQDPGAPPDARTDAKPSAAQIEQLNKQLDAMRKQLDATQAQLKTLKDSGSSASTVSPEAPSAPTAPEAPVAPEAPAAEQVTQDSVSRLGGSYTVAENEVVNGDARVVGGSLTVDGKVRGEASALGGSLRINGEVDGNATVTGGSMYLGPDAVVRGNVSVTGGSLHREDGSRVNGSVRVTGGSRGGTYTGTLNFPSSSTRCGILDGPFPLPLGIMLFIAGLFLLTACPKRIDTIGRAFINQPMYSLLVGVASIPLSIILFVVSAITIVGPIMVTFGMFAAFFMGLVAVALMLGRRLVLGKNYKSRLFPLFIGLAVWVAASAFSHTIGPAQALMSIATSVAIMMALGAAIGTGWGKNPGWLKNKMEGNRGGTPWVDPNYTYAGTQDAYRDIA